MAPRKRASQTSPSSQKKALTRAAAGAQFTCCTSTKRYKYTVTPRAAPRQIRRTTRPHLKQFTRFTSTKKICSLALRVQKSTHTDTPRSPEPDSPHATAADATKTDVSNAHTTGSGNSVRTEAPTGRAALLASSQNTPAASSSNPAHMRTNYNLGALPPSSAATSRVGAGSRFTCFTSTKVQILTHRLRAQHLQSAAVNLATSIHLLY